MEYRLKKILKEKDISISQLAGELGMQRESLSRIVNGASTSSETLLRIANCLNIHIADLFARPVEEVSSEMKCPNCGVALVFKMKEVSK